LLISDTL